MSMDDFFRGFFGFHNPPGSFGHRRPQYDQDDSNQDDPCDNDDDDVTFRFHFSETEDLFRHFEDMFKNMGLADFPPPPMLPGSVIPGPDGKPGRSQNPRDNMLKEPDAFTDDPNPDRSKRPKVFEPILPYKDTEPSNKPFFFRDVFKIPKWGGVHPRDKQDKDLDGEISSEDFDKIVAESKSNPKKIVPVQPEQPRSYFKSVSISTVRGPDGKLEQRRTVRDGAGNEETTVTRSLGIKATPL
ncbi:unnamed protein product [Owenia fusiformis]|uniref:Uncharacterized protein n=1 Tax=Owenia fusiformis TaxID=6347 RepID=A0A8J1TWR9_OWEFU|nr:unnamed protein product [Owenia fusiformis]